MERPARRLWRWMWSLSTTECMHVLARDVLAPKCKGFVRFRGRECQKFLRVAPQAGAAMRLAAGAARFFVQQMLYRLS